LTAEEVNATLVTAGWLVNPGTADDPLCDAERVASELDIARTTARRWMADGTLPTLACYTRARTLLIPFQTRNAAADEQLCCRRRACG
jgi:hypothetical protein